MTTDSLIRFAIAGSSPQTDDSALIDRIVKSYRLAILTPLGSLDSFWLKSFFELKRDVHSALLSENMQEIKELLRDPSRTDLFYGFEALARSLIPLAPDRVEHPRQLYNALIQLSEAVGGRRVPCPEYLLEAPDPDVEMLLRELDSVFNCRIDFPTPFAGEYGLYTSRGIMSLKAVQAIYQAWRLVQLVGGFPRPRILEIGGGLGRTTYYAWQFGLRDYTLIDLPMTGVAQANFLGRVLGEQFLQLHGEVQKSGIRILPPEMFLAQKDRYDLVLNVDSLVEMAPQTALAYCDAIEARAGMFLSINHEYGRFKARDVFAGRCMYRAPYWLRPGYVEELTGRFPSVRPSSRPNIVDLPLVQPPRAIEKRRG